MLENKVAIITGGTRGIGFETVRQFLLNGARVCLLGSRKETVDKALNSLSEYKDNIMGLYPNLNSEEEMEKTFKEVKEKYGKIDILINNAGISSHDKLYDYKIEDFEKIININLNSVFICSKIASKYMKEQGGGVILNTSSMVSLYGQPSGCGYPASKFAVNGITKSLARELGKDNIRVNAVAPGVVHTDMVDALKEEMIKPLINTIPLHRMAEPIDIANAFVFLASDMASYISGEILSVDGAIVS